MAFYEWIDDYSCGIEGIDDQHKVIIGLMNKLFIAIESGNDESIMKEVFLELLEYANYHFNLELKLFKKYHYNNEERHIEEHDHYIEKIKTLMIHDYMNSGEVAIETLNYLRKWFTNHMLKTDMDYCKYFKYMELIHEVDKLVKTEDLVQRKKY